MAGEGLAGPAAYRARHRQEAQGEPGKIPIQKKQKAVEKAIRQTLAEMLPSGVQYTLQHHPSCSHYGLQVADYCNWAVLRKWQRGETHYYGKVRTALRSEFDIFEAGTTRWY